jgi:hypothetical protein
MCVCDDGWSNIGDQALISGTSCNINIVGIQILWGLLLVMSLIPSLLTAIWGIKTRIQYKRDGISLYNNIRKTWRLYSIPIGLLLYSICMIIIALGKIIDPTQWIIGLHPAPTVLFFFGLAFSDMGVQMGSLATIEFAVTQVITIPSLTHEKRQALKTHLQRAKLLLMIYTFSIISVNIISIGVLWSPEHVHIFTGIWGGVLVIGLLINTTFIQGPIFSRILNNVESTLSELAKNTTGDHHNLEPLQALQVKFTQLVWVVKVLPIHGIIILICCTWPLLISLFSYTYPILIFATGPSVGTFVQSTTTTTNKSSNKSNSVKVSSNNNKDEGDDNSKLNIFQLLLLLRGGCCCGLSLGSNNGSNTTKNNVSARVDNHTTIMSSSTSSPVLSSSSQGGVGVIHQG